MKAVSLNTKYFPDSFSSFFQGSRFFVLEGPKHVDKVTEKMMEPLKIHVKIYETMEVKVLGCCQI